MLAEHLLQLAGIETDRGQQRGFGSGEQRAGFDRGWVFMACIDFCGNYMAVG